MLRNLADKVFDRPICEALLDQRFFNGIGNYLRAEILYRLACRPRIRGLGWLGAHIPHCLACFPLSTHCRLRIPPFEKARTVLEALKQHRLVRVQGRRHTHLPVRPDRVWAGAGVSCNPSRC